MAARESTNRVRATRPRNRKEIILRTATEHFLRTGYHNTAMGDIATEVGITSTALYRHFRNKQELLSRAVTDALRLTADRIAEARSPEDLVDVLTEHSLTYRGLPALWQREARYLPTDTQLAILREIIDANHRVSTTIAHFRPELAAEDAELLAWSIFGIFDSVSHHKAELPRERFERLLRGMAHTALRVQFRERDTAHEHPPLPALDTPVLPHGPIEHMSRRDRLVALAAKLFSKNGYAEVGIEDIGAAAGITGPSVYYHFASKADLLGEIIDRAAKATEIYVDRAFTESDSPVRTVELLLHYYLSFAFTNGHLVWVAVSELTHLPPLQEKKHREIQRAAITRWSDALAQIRTGLTRTEARVIVQAVIMIINDVVRLRNLTPRSFTAADVMPITRAIMLTPTEGG